MGINGKIDPQGFAVYDDAADFLELNKEDRVCVDKSLNDIEMANGCANWLFEWSEKSNASISTIARHDKDGELTKAVFVVRGNTARAFLKFVEALSEIEAC